MPIFKSTKGHQAYQAAEDAIIKKTNDFRDAPQQKIAITPSKPEVPVDVKV